MANPTITKTIKVASVGSKDGRYTITDQDKVTYSFFESWEEEDTSGFATFKMLDVKKDSVVDIIYVDKEGESHGKKVTYHNIYEFKPAEGEATKTAPARIMNGEDKKWNDIGLAKAATAIIVALIATDKPLTVAKTELKDWLVIVQQIQTNGVGANVVPVAEITPEEEAAAEASKKEEEELPVIDIEDENEVKVEDIPF